MIRARWIAWLEAMEPARQAALAEDVAARAVRYGLAVQQADGTRVPIPITLTPAVMDRGALADAAQGARHIASAVARVAGDLVTSGDPLGARMMAELTPLERECIALLPRPARLPAIRVDFFPGEEGPRILEVNATIPAMQGYSDAAARALCEGVAPARAGEALALLPSNRDQLLDALLECLASLSPGNHSPPINDSRYGSNIMHVRSGNILPPGARIAVVHRPGDSQLPELESLLARARERGIEAGLFTPDRVSLVPEGPLADGAPVDLVYRHVFGRRVEPDAPFAGVLRDPVRGRVFNPLDAHLEAKAVVARLSELCAEPSRAAAAGLSEAEVDAVRRLVPWTRLAGQGPTSDPEGRPTEDPALWAARHPMRAVLKRSWDYGGKSVILADRLDEPASRARAAVLGGGDWQALCTAAARAPELWVVQERIPARAERHFTRNGWQDLFVDLCTYTAVGLTHAPSGGVVRAAIDPVVNIVGGGGLAPLLTPEAAEILLS